MRKSRLFWITATAMTAMVATLAPLGAQQQPATPPAPEAAPAPTPAPPGPPPCSGPEFRQFDFWLGDWDVKLPNGKVAGTNSIKSVLGGCVLQESWEGTGQVKGFSFNIYDATTKTWHQTWVDNGGNLLNLNGGLVDGKMVLSGETVDDKGVKTINRITWTKVDADHVRQLWEASGDGGKTWQVAFDGQYAKKKP